MIVAGSNLGGTAGYVMYVPVPSRTILFGAFFIIRNRSEQPEQIGDEKGRLNHENHDRKNREQTQHAC